jgi:hypothetical protein
MKTDLFNIYAQLITLHFFALLQVVFLFKDSNYSEFK